MGIQGLAVLITLLLASPSAADDGESVALSTVPEVVMQIARQTAPKIAWTSAFKEKVDEGEFKECYRLVGKDDKQRTVTLKALPDGSIVYVRTEIASEDVPAIVAAALKAGKPDFIAKRFEAVGPEGSIFYYRFEGQLANGEKIVMAVRADGKRVIQEDE
jgi:hypothetical protein